MTTEKNDTPDNSPTPTTSEASPASARASDLGESFGAFHPLPNERPNGPSTHEASARREPTSSISNGHQADLHDARLSQVTPPWHQQAVFNRALPPLRFRGQFIKLSTVGHQPKRKLARKMQY
ncbi:hypothetical protein DVH05_022622 [Phytophthora capsici]|nr:hypothetical protein DVH05_022622 [Phytophthora capsici]